jgi:DNA helicase-2/ATP-dependent DNA helicase PcrA
MSSFDDDYKKLNAAQKKAVDTIDGAVLVIAGPGTGKTQLLSLRVANILDKSDALPDSILCLTFTNKAANNMQQRVTRLTGPAGHRVMIKTFHSFAAEVMNLYPEYFWNGAALTNVPDAVQLEILTDILSSLPLENPLALKFAGQFTSIRSVQDALKLSKEAGLTPEKLKLLVNLNVKYIDKIEDELVDVCSERLSYKKLDELALRISQLPEQNTDELTRPLIALSTVIKEEFETAHSLDSGTKKTKNTSAWKSRWIKSIEGIKGMHEERKRNDWWLHLSDVYENYRNILHARGFYDYSDMIIEVITQLEQRPDMRADIQEKFQYVLIDEFQDTNAAQLRLAHLVADHEAQEGNPNIMAVGDDDQSIYKFNGAELSNMRGFKRSYPEAKEYILTENYRSSQAVLDFSKLVIEQASERLSTTNPAMTKTLISMNPPKMPSIIEHISYPTKEHEYYGIAKLIGTAKKNGSVAVLARSHESLRSIASALHQQNVPVRYEQQQNVLEQPLIVQINYVSEIVIALGEGDEATSNKFLPLVLAGTAWQIEPLELWQLAVQNRHNPHWLESMLSSKNGQLQTIAHWLLWLAGEAKTLALPQMLELIIGLRASEHLTSPLRRYYLEADDIDTPYLANISAVRKLTGLAQDFCKQGEAMLADFMRLINVSIENERIITDESLFVTAEDAVELLTVHKAKGLEFDSVFIIDAMESIWKPSSNGRKPPANLPLRPSGDNFDDYVRLMFVAATRAKKDIYIGSYYTSEAGQEALPSAIIRDVLPPRVVNYNDAKNPVAVLEAGLAWPRLEGSLEKALLKNILETYSLSPSAYLDFLDVTKGGPHYFLEKHLLRLPEATMTAAAFGSAVHSALQIAQQLVTDKRFELAKVMNAYELALQKQLLGKVDYERYLVHGQKVIARLFDDYNFKLNPSGRAEVGLSVVLKNATISGKLDMIDLDSGTKELIISDYKTGKPLSSFQTRSHHKMVKAWRHRTQLQLYALMAEATGRYTHTGPIKTQMLYVEAETKNELVLPYVPEPHELERLAHLVEIVFDKISSLNLPDVRNYSEDFAGITDFEDDLLNGKI